MVARAPRSVLARAYSVVAEGAAAPGKRKVWNSADEAVADVKSGSTVLSGGTISTSFIASHLYSLLACDAGFGLCGTPGES